jgi:hypothetical protein
MGLLGQTLCQLEKVILNQRLAALISLEGAKIPKKPSKNRRDSVFLSPDSDSLRALSLKTV